MVTIKPFIKSFILNFSPSLEYDVEYYKVHAVHSDALVNGDFTPTESNLITEGPDTVITHSVDKGGTWYIKIAAVDTFGEDLLNYSQLYSVVVPSLDPLDQVPPDVPVFNVLPAGEETGIEFSGAVDNIFIKVAWTLAIVPDDFLHYILAYKKHTDIDWNEISTTDTNYKLTGLVSGVSYDFKVKAVDQWNNSSAFSSIKTVSAKTDTVAPATPTNLTAVTAFKSIFLDWSKNNEDDFCEYTLQVSTSNSFSTYFSYACGTNSFTYTGVAGTTYYFRVNAVDYSGNSSAWSSTISANSSLIGGNDLSNLIIDATKLADSAVTSTKIANLAVGNAAIANLAVSTAKIADLAVDTGKIAELAITDAKIANATITSAKIYDLIADKITTGTLSATTSISVGDGKVKLEGANSRLVIANNAGTVADMVTVGKLAAGNYGISIKDKNGNQVFKVDESGARIENLTAGTIDANAVTINNLVVGRNVTMGQDAYISWVNVTNTPSIPNGTFIDSEGVYTRLISASQIEGGIINATVSVNTPNVNIQDANITGIPTISKNKGAIVGNNTGDVFINVEDGVNWSKFWHERNEQLLNTKSSLGTYYPIFTNNLRENSSRWTACTVGLPFGADGEYLLWFGYCPLTSTKAIGVYSQDRYNGKIKGASLLPWTTVSDAYNCVYTGDSDEAYRSYNATKTVLVGGQSGNLAYYQYTIGYTTVPTFTKLTALNLTGYHIQIIRTNGKRWLICARATDTSGLTKVMITNADYASPLVLANWTTISYENFAASVAENANTFIAADIYDDRIIIISINDLQISAKWSYLSSISWNTIQFYDRDNNLLTMNNSVGGGSWSSDGACHYHYRYNAHGFIFIPVYKNHTTNPFTGYIAAARYYKIDPNIGGTPFGKLFFDSYEDSYGACKGYVASGMTTVETAPFTDSSITAAIMTLPTDAAARNSIMFITKGTKQTTGFYNTIMRTGNSTNHGYNSGFSRNANAFARVGAFTRGQSSDNIGAVDNGHKLPLQSIFWSDEDTIYVSQPANLLVVN